MFTPLLYEEMKPALPGKVGFSSPPHTAKRAFTSLRFKRASKDESVFNLERKSWSTMFSSVTISIEGTCSTLNGTDNERHDNSLDGSAGSSFFNLFFRFYVFIIAAPVN